MSLTLLVHPDADAWLDAHPELSEAVATARSAKEARAYLAGTAFDAIYIGPGVEGKEAVAALRDVLGLSTPIETLAALDALLPRLVGPGSEGGEDMSEVLDAIAGELSRVAHSLNNPLAVIAGNAQLGLEMARATSADATVIEALESITEAAGRLEVLFREVSGLRARVDRARKEG